MYRNQSILYLLYSLSLSLTQDIYSDNISRNFTITIYQCINFSSHYATTRYQYMWSGRCLMMTIPVEVSDQLLRWSVSCRNLTSLSEESRVRRVLWIVLVQRVSQLGTTVIPSQHRNLPPGLALYSWFKLPTGSTPVAQTKPEIVNK